MPVPLPRPRAGALLVASLLLGCHGPLDHPEGRAATLRTRPDDAAEAVVAERRAAATTEAPADLAPDATVDDYLALAMSRNPSLESAFQHWRAAAERVPQAAGLPDPRLTAGVYLDEVETRVGPQQARFGASQTLPWPGRLDDRRDAAAGAARAAWWRLEGARLAVHQRLLAALHELRWLDRATAIARENLALLASFEEVVRARYRVGAGGHPELIRVQVALLQLEDRVRQLETMRPSYVAGVNAVLGRAADAPIVQVPALPELVADLGPNALAATAVARNPALRALDEEREQRRALLDAARKEGLPDFTVGVEYIVTGEARDPSMPESGDDPVIVTLGVNVPIWRERYEAAEGEAIASRLAVVHQRADEANRIVADLHRAWFEHADADRRVRLYGSTLIPKSEESLQASLASFRAGDASLLDLLETERTLLEFSLALARARADRGIALARLHALCGAPIPAHDADAAPPAAPEDRP